MAETIKVIIPPNIRYFDDYDTDVTYLSGQEYVMQLRQLRSNNIKKGLLNGMIRVIQGEIRFFFKDSEVVVKGEKGGNTFITFVSEGKETKVEFSAQKIPPKILEEMTKANDVPKKEVYKAPIATQKPFESVKAKPTFKKK